MIKWAFHFLTFEMKWAFHCPDPPRDLGQPSMEACASMLSGSGKGRICKAIFLILGLCQREKQTFVLSEHPVAFVVVVVFSGKAKAGH